MLKLKYFKTISYENIILPSCFFIFFFFFVFLFVDSHIIYNYNGVHKYSYIFELSKEYFFDTIKNPGGILKLLLILIFYSCQFKFFASLLITFIAWSIYYSTKSYIESLGYKGLIILYYVPVFLIFIILTRYNFHYFYFILSALFSVAFAILYKRILSRNLFFRIIILILLILFLYFFCSLLSLLFVFLVFIYETLKEKKHILYFLLISAITVILIILSEKYLFPLPLQKAFKYQNFLELHHPNIYLFLYFFVIAALLRIGLAVKINYLCNIKNKILYIISKLAQTVILLGAIIFLLLWINNNFVNKNIRELGQTLYYVNIGDWEKILQKRKSQLFRDFPNIRNRTLLIITHSIYRALYQTNRLGTELFSFPQVCDPEPLLLKYHTMNIYFPAWIVALDLYMELGAVNYAEKIAGEAMENMGFHPNIVYNRILLQLAMGNKELARLYFNRLSKIVGQKKHIKELNLIINGEKDIFSNSKISHLLLLMDKQDYTTSRATLASEEKILLNLLNANNKNKMAFEYLMAYYLITRQPSKIAENIYRLEQLGYKEIPTLYEEAILVYSRINPLDNKKLNITIRQSTYSKFERFEKEYELYMQGVPGIMENLVKNFGNSYFFFHIFGYIPWRNN